MLNRTSGLILALALLAAAAGGWWQLHRQAAPSFHTAAAGFHGPDLRLRGLDGQLHRLSDYSHHQRVLLNFWATWCAPCQREMPVLAAAQAHYNNQGLTIIGIANDDQASLHAFLTTHTINYPILLDPGEAAASMAQWGDWHQLLPYTVLINAQGRVLASHLGEFLPGQLARWIDAHPDKS